MIKNLLNKIKFRDDDICNVCSYEGSDLTCVRCKDGFHLECINLKRPPRYNFICSKCKVKEDKRKVKVVDEGMIKLFS